MFMNMPLKELYWECKLHSRRIVLGDLHFTNTGKRMTVLKGWVRE